jgi:hypothetical protein
LSSGSTAQDELKQHFVDAIRQVLLEWPVEATPSSGKSEIPAASLLMELLGVFQATPSDATTGPSKLASVGVEKDVHCQPPLGGHGGTPPNSPRITPPKPATICQPKESIDLLSPSPDDPSAYSIYAAKPGGTASDSKVSEYPKFPVPGGDVHVATVQNLETLNGDQATPISTATAVEGGQRLAEGALALKKEVRKSCEK